MNGFISCSFITKKKISLIYKKEEVQRIQISKGVKKKIEIENRTRSWNSFNQKRMTKKRRKPIKPKFGSKETSNTTTIANQKDLINQLKPTKATTWRSTKWWCWNKEPSVWKPNNNRLKKQTGNKRVTLVVKLLTTKLTGILTLGNTPPL